MEQALIGVLALAVGIAIGYAARDAHGREPALGELSTRRSGC